MSSAEAEEKWESWTMVPPDQHTPWHAFPFAQHFDPCSAPLGTV